MGEDKDGDEDKDKAWTGIRAEKGYMYPNPLPVFDYEDIFCLHPHPLLFSVSIGESPLS